MPEQVIEGDTIFVEDSRQQTSGECFVNCF